MQCPRCGGYHFRCTSCGEQFDAPDIEDRIESVLRKSRRPMHGTAIAVRAGVPTSTAYRWLDRMVANNELIKLPGRGGYRLVAGVLQLAA